MYITMVFLWGCWGSLCSFDMVLWCCWGAFFGSYGGFAGLKLAVKRFHGFDGSLKMLVFVSVRMFHDHAGGCFAWRSMSHSWGF